MQIASLNGNGYRGEQHAQQSRPGEESASPRNPSAGVAFVQDWRHYYNSGYDPSNAAQTVVIHPDDDDSPPAGKGAVRPPQPYEQGEQPQPKRGSLTALMKDHVEFLWDNLASFYRRPSVAEEQAQPSGHADVNQVTQVAESNKAEEGTDYGETAPVVEEASVPQRLYTTKSMMLQVQQEEATSSGSRSNKSPNKQNNYTNAPVNGLLALVNGRQ